mmetsp:Transcript_9864/g.17179  ORF Transcript_9864/g.17179 Transcript_9864/m.17179 type:complete len:216 (+) Transcript_9864:46-693(+)
MRHTNCVCCYKWTRGEAEFEQKGRRSRAKREDEIEQQMPLVSLGRSKEQPLDGSVDVASQQPTHQSQRTIEQTKKVYEGTSVEEPSVDGVLEEVRLKAQSMDGLLWQTTTGICQLKTSSESAFQIDGTQRLKKAAEIGTGAPPISNNKPRTTENNKPRTENKPRRYQVTTVDEPPVDAILDEVRRKAQSMDALLNSDWLLPNQNNVSISISARRS